MKKSGTLLRVIIFAACIGGILMVPGLSSGAPQTSFSPLRGKKNLANFARISLKDIRELEKSPFDIPDFLRPAVKFWTNVYTRYSSDQVVLHDKKYLQIVYIILNFTDIYDRNISYRRKRRLRRKRIEANRKKFRQALKKLSRKKINPAKLSGLEKEVYNLFKGIREKNKFKEAIKRVRAQIGHRRSFRSGLVNSGLFIKEMEKIFASYDLPVELTRLPFVESFFNLKAFSKRGASGIWQFIRSTGRLFLTINNIVDERNDPFKATHAAAKLLKGNYEELGSWPLAVTAYNHGRLGVSRAVKAVGSENLGDIIEKYRRNRFGFASRNFYAEFLAALNIYQDSSRYFGNIIVKEPFSFDTFKLPDYVSARSLAKYCSLSPEVIREYNSEFSVSVISSQQFLPKGYELKIPLGMKEKLLKKYAAMPGRFKMVSQRALDRHKVRRGQTLSQIAKKYRVRVADVVALNNLSSRNFIRSGQVLKLPIPASQRHRQEKKVAKAKSSKKSVKTARVKQQKKTVPAKTKPSSKPRRKKVAKKKALEKSFLTFFSAKEKDKSTSWGTLVIKKALGNPRMISSFSRRDSFINKPVAAVVNYPNKPDAPVIDYLTEGDTVVVLSHETLGHLADWADTEARRIRRLNSLPFGRALKVGQAIKIDFEKVDRGIFHAKRRQYHLDLQNLYLSRYKVDRVEKHILKKRQNVWTLCQRVYKIPLWLLKKYNTKKDLAKLIPGDALHVPIVVKNN